MEELSRAWSVLSSGTTPTVNFPFPADLWPSSHHSGGSGGWFRRLCSPLPLVTNPVPIRDSGPWAIAICCICIRAVSRRTLGKGYLQ